MCFQFETPNASGLRCHAQEVFWIRRFGDDGSLLAVPIVTLIGKSESHDRVKVNPGFNDGKNGGKTALIEALRNQSKRNICVSNGMITVAVSEVIEHVKEVANATTFTVLLDGTGNDWPSGTHVSEAFGLLNDQSVHYYGGVGNPLEYDKKFVGVAHARNWADIIDRAFDDIQKKLNPSPGVHVDLQINLMGFSRGAAMCVELARKLDKAGIVVNFMGLYDPVYSYVFAGQKSLLVNKDDVTAKGNYTWIELPEKVKHVAVAISQHEERSWFPATFFTVNANPENHTVLVQAVAPGVHSDVGGGVGQNTGFMSISGYWMWQQATAAGVHMTKPADPMTLQEIQDTDINRLGINPGGWSAQAGGQMLWDNEIDLQTLLLDEGLGLNEGKLARDMNQGIDALHERIFTSISDEGGNIRYINWDVSQFLIDKHPTNTGTEWKP